MKGPSVIKELNMGITSLPSNLRFGRNSKSRKLIRLEDEKEHCVKSVRIRSFSGPYFPAFGLNTERYGVSLRIQSECGKIRTKKTPNTDTFHAMENKNRKEQNFPNENFCFLFM